MCQCTCLFKKGFKSIRLGSQISGCLFNSMQNFFLSVSDKKALKKCPDETKCNWGHTADPQLLEKINKKIADRGQQIVGDTKAWMKSYEAGDFDCDNDERNNGRRWNS